MRIAAAGTQMREAKSHNLRCEISAQWVGKQPLNAQVPLPTVQQLSWGMIWLRYDLSQMGPALNLPKTQRRFPFGSQPLAVYGQLWRGVAESTTAACSTHARSSFAGLSHISSCPCAGAAPLRYMWAASTSVNGVPRNGSRFSRCLPRELKLTKRCIFPSLL